MPIYRYSYLISDVFLLAIWLILFALRKDVRKEMIIISIIFAVIGPIVEFVYVVDWWHPLTITGTTVGFEDFLFGFTVAGISSSIYEEIFKKKIKLRKSRKIIIKKENINIFSILALLSVMFFGLFYLLKINSFYTSTIVFLVGIIITLNKRPDLFLDSLASGVLVFLVALIGFIFSEAVSPGFIQNFWFTKLLSGIYI